MKVGEQLKCDNCGSTWITRSPPPKEAYESKRLHIEKLTVLLPEKIVQQHHKKGIADSHALTIENADFCDLQCLIVFINRFMKGEDISAFYPER